MEQQQQSSKPSLAGWKAGQKMMTTASAAEVVAKSAPKQKPKSNQKRPKQPAGKDKPFAEKTKEEKFGTTPRTVVMAKQVKDVLAYLETQQDRGSCITWDEIVAEAIPEWYDTIEGGELYNQLMHNPVVEATATGFTYRSEHGIKDKASLLKYIRTHPGKKANELKDGYGNLLRDVDQLQAEGAVYKFYNAEFKVDVFFAAPENRSTAPEDLVDVYLKTQLPSEPSELATSLTKMGMRSALASATSQRKPIALMKQERPKKKRRTQPRHMTNVHLATLLSSGEAQQFTSIDRK